MPKRTSVADDTPIRVMQEGQKGTKQGHVWIYRHEYMVVFRFSFSRGRDGPIEFLGDIDNQHHTDNGI